MRKEWSREEFDDLRGTSEDPVPAAQPTKRVKVNSEYLPFACMYICLTVLSLVSDSILVRVCWSDSLQLSLCC